MALKEKAAKLSDPFVITLIATQAVPQVSPQKQTLTIDTAASPMTVKATSAVVPLWLDWLDAAPQLQTKLAIELALMGGRMGR